MKTAKSKRSQTMWSNWHGMSHTTWSHWHGMSHSVIPMTWKVTVWSHWHGMSHTMWSHWHGIHWIHESVKTESRLRALGGGRGERHTGTKFSLGWTFTDVSVYVFMCMWVQVLAEDGTGSLGAGVINSWKLSDLDAGNWTHILCESRKHS